MVQSVTGQAVVAPVEQAVGDGAAAPSANGAGAAFDLTGLLDTVSANAELTGVAATDAPPAALAVAALKANAGLAAAAVSKPLDVSSLSSVDAGLASLLMLKQTVSKGLSASAEAKTPATGKAGDLANITLTLKMTPQPLEMAPLVPVSPSAEAVPSLDPVSGEALPLPVDGLTIADPAVGDLHAVSPEAVVPADQMGADGVGIIPQPVADAAQPLVLDEHGQVVIADPALVQPASPMPVEAGDQQPIQPVEAQIVVPQPVLVQPVAVDAKQDGFKIALGHQASDTAAIEQQSAVVSGSAHDSSGLGILNVATAAESADADPAQSVLAGLADAVKDMSKVSTEVKGVAVTDASGLAVASGLEKLASVPTQSIASGPAVLVAAKAGKSDAGLPDGAASSEKTSADQNGVGAVHSHGQGAVDIASIQTPAIQSGSVDPALLVQQQALQGAQMQVQQAVHQQVVHPQAGVAVAQQASEAVSSLPSGTINTKAPTGFSSASSQDGAIRSNNETILAEQLVVQRDTDSRDALDQQASNRQFDQQMADRRADDEAGLKTKAADHAQSGDSGRDPSGQSPDQGSSGANSQKPTVMVTSANEHETVTGSFVATGGVSSGETMVMGGVQSGGAVSDNALSRAIMNVQYALTGSASGRTGPATAAEMRFQSLGQQVLAALRANSHDIELTLNPSQLGQVVLKLNVDGSKVRVSAKTESKMTDEALKAGEGELKASLQAQGFVLDGFDVSHDDDRRRAPKAETEGATVAQSQDGEAFSIDVIA